ncbi:hypothetical protein JKP88DRAFT_338687 [Tribonema minus]|uniref:Cytidyltransferase-like domain-containing protein n=1 Tax=Tribonema minus TaxID=303371 RepID=A0A835YHC7_9STRA|nr:hypothetical protein JKP88DRAFT_338687 [Tribonema minus]
MGRMRHFVSDLYAQLWDSACLQDKRLLDVRVHLPGEGFKGGTMEEAALSPQVSIVMTERHEGDAQQSLQRINARRAACGLAAASLLSLRQVAEQAYDDACYYLEEDYGHEEPLTFNSVACGGTFDNLHSGHKKLLTAAASCCKLSGILTVGVTADAMLTSKKLSHLIDGSAARIAAVASFLDDIRPGLRHRVVVIDDPFGPPAYEPEFEAIVVSSETIKGAHKINSMRAERAFKPLKVAVTRRTEAASLCSSTLRNCIAAQQQSQQQHQ